MANETQNGNGHTPPSPQIQCKICNRDVELHDTMQLAQCLKVFRDRVDFARILAEVNGNMRGVRMEIGVLAAAVPSTVAPSGQRPKFEESPLPKPVSFVSKGKKQQKVQKAQ